MFEHLVSKNGVFIKYRLDLKGFREIIELLGSQLVKSAGNSKEVIFDSTPLITIILYSIPIAKLKWTKPIFSIMATICSVCSILMGLSTIDRVFIRL